MSHKLVIVGGGAGGLELATTLGTKLHNKDVDVVLVDSGLTHIWKPLLHEVAAGVMDSAREGLSYAAQAKWNHFRFVCGRMNGLDRARRVIKLAFWVGPNSHVVTPAIEIDYDTLVIAVGSVGDDFGTPGVANHCLFLDSAAQAEALRSNLLERHISHVAQNIETPLRIAIVGGGATGVELSAELFDANRRLSYYHQTREEGLEDLDITLLEAGPTLLPALPERLGTGVRTNLEGMGIKVRLGAKIAAAEADGFIDAEGHKIEADVMVWTAGVRAPDFLHEIDGLESNNKNQLLVDSRLQTTRDDNIFAFGDCAACPVERGSSQNVAALAQAAHQQSVLLADNLQRRLNNQPLRDFTFRDKGTLVSLASQNTFGKLWGQRIIEGRLARVFYVSLYQLHQAALYGPCRTAWRMLNNTLSRSTRPKLKLH